MPSFYGDVSLDPAAMRRIAALTNMYGKVADRLREIEAGMTEGTYRRAYLERQIREANRTIFRLLDLRKGDPTGDVTNWARDHFPAVYGYGASRTIDDFERMGFAYTRGSQRVHTQAVEALIAKYQSESEEIALQLVGNTVRAGRIVLHSNAFATDIAAGLIGGMTRRDVSGLLRRTIQAALDEEITPDMKLALAKVRVGGREWDVDAWAEMHARTESARASTAGNRVLCSENGVGHVRITTHAHPTCICTPFEGRIYSLKQGDPRFPWIGSVPRGGCPMHPNCVHREGPAVIALMEERGEIGDRDTLPEDFVGLSERELAKKIRDHRRELEPFARAPNGFMPANFKLGSPNVSDAVVKRRVAAAVQAVAPAEIGSVFSGPTFEPAKSLAEAREHGSRLANHYGFNGAKLDVMNEINAGLATVIEPFGFKLGASDWIGSAAISKRRVGRAMGVYRHRLGGPDLNDQLGFQKTFAASAKKKAAEQMQNFTLLRNRNLASYQAGIADPTRPEPLKEILRQKLAAQTNAIRWSAITDSPRPLFATAAHEAGHAIYYRMEMGNDFRKFLTDANVGRLDWYKVSEYGASKIEELFAEVTALYAEGRQAAVPAPIREAYEKTIDAAKRRLKKG